MATQLAKVMWPTAQIFKVMLFVFIQPDSLYKAVLLKIPRNFNVNQGLLNNRGFGKIDFLLNFILEDQCESHNRCLARVTLLHQPHLEEMVNSLLR
jgi:hypothetical protein